jgi:CBS domain-containing protein
MQTDVRTVGPELPLVELEREFLESRMSGFPVVEGGRLVGVVTRSDVVRQLSLEQSVAEVLSDFYRDAGDPGDEPSRSLEAIGLQIGRRLEELRVKDVMVHALLEVAPGDSLEAVAACMVRRRIHRLPVVADGALVGIVSSLDLVRLFAEGRVAPA